MAGVLQAINNRLTAFGLKPLHPCTICFYYIPMKGCISYSLLATEMLAPELYDSYSFMGVQKYISFENACLANSMIGSTLYLFSRPHMKKSSAKERIPLCIFGAVMFNFGSMLLFALARSWSPDCTAARTIIGFSGSVGLLYLGKKYIDIVDAHVEDTNH